MTLKNYHSPGLKTPIRTPSGLQEFEVQFIMTNVIKKLILLRNDLWAF